MMMAALDESRGSDLHTASSVARLESQSQRMWIDMVSGLRRYIKQRAEVAFDQSSRKKEHFYCDPQLNRWTR